MFKPTILIVPVLFVAMTGPSLAGDRDVATALPCNLLCERWMAMGKPTTAVDLHPAIQPVAVPAVAAAPPAARGTTVSASVTPAQRSPSLPAIAPLPPRRPVVVATLRPPHEQHAMLMSHPQPASPPIPLAPAPVAVALAPVPVPVAPQPNPATASEPVRQRAADPERPTSHASIDRPVTKPIDFVLPSLDPLPSSQPITVPPTLDVIAAVLLAGQTQP